MMVAVVVMMRRGNDWRETNGRNGGRSPRRTDSKRFKKKEVRALQGIQREEL